MPRTFSGLFGCGAPDFCILIAHLNEPQLIDSILKIDEYCKRKGITIEVKIFSGYGNYDVHELIYRHVNEYNIPVVKLDADMIIENFELLHSIIKGLQDADIIISPVYCHIARMNIFGVHIFGRAVNGLRVNNALFPDKYLYKDLILAKIDSLASVSHCKNPDVGQVTNFIGHRLRKFVRSYFLSMGHFFMAVRGLRNHYRVLFKIVQLIRIVFASEYRAVPHSKDEAAIPFAIRNHFH